MVNSLHNTDGRATLLIGQTYIPVRIDTIDHVPYESMEFSGHVLDSQIHQGRRVNVDYNAYRASGVSVNPFEIKDVIFNNPATIVFWADGTKTVVKCQEDDIYDEEVGLALCFAKKALGNKSNFNNVFKKWVPEVQSDYVYQGTVELSQDIRCSAADALEKLVGKLRRPITPGEV